MTNVVYPIEVALVDDDVLFVEALSESLKSDSRFEVMGVFNSGENVLEFLSTRGDVVSIDILLVSVSMPGMNGLEVLRVAMSLGLNVRCLVMTAFDTDAIMLQALMEGAAGYLIKSDPLENISRSIVDAMDGGTFLSSRCLSRLLRYTPFSKQGDTSLEALELSVSEKQILLLLSRGYSNREIGQTMGYADSTVKKYIGNLLRYFNVKSRVQLALLAVEIVRSN